MVQISSPMRKYIDWKEQLLDPRWTALRDEAAVYYDLTCRRCSTKVKEIGDLEMHHIKYDKLLPGLNPEVDGDNRRYAWEYKISELEPVCKPCHDVEHDTPPTQYTRCLMCDRKIGLRYQWCEPCNKARAKAYKAKIPYLVCETCEYWQDDNIVVPEEPDMKPCKVITPQLHTSKHKKAGPVYIDVDFPTSPPRLCTPPHFGCRMYTPTQAVQEAVKSLK